MPVKASQLTLTLHLAKEVIFRLLLHADVPDLHCAFTVTSGKGIFIVWIESHVLNLDTWIGKLKCMALLHSQVPQVDVLVE